MHRGCRAAAPEGKEREVSSDPVDSEGVRRLLRSLRAHRRYRPERVAPALVEGWLEAARWCGSSRNSQPWRFVVVEDRRVLADLSGFGEDALHLRDAAVAIAIAAVEGPFAFSTIFDLGRVSQTLMLAAAADGVGSCIAVFEPASNIDQAREVLGVPSSCRLDLAVGFGYPDHGVVERRPDRPRRGRLPINEISAWGGGLTEWSTDPPDSAGTEEAPYG